MLACYGWLAARRHTELGVQIRFSLKVEKRMPWEGVFRSAWLVANIFVLVFVRPICLDVQRSPRFKIDILKQFLYANLITGGRTAGKLHFWGVCLSAPSGRLTFGTDSRFLTNPMAVFEK
jgi:hypothetical protein